MLELGYHIIIALLLALTALSAVATFFPNFRISKIISTILERSPRNLSDFNDQEWYSLSDISIIEKYIPNIESIVIICSIVQQPERMLYAAVADNFQQGARYAFYVSKSNIKHDDIILYTHWFKSIFEKARENAPTSGDNSAIWLTAFSDRFSVQSIGFDWESAPYIFYCYKDMIGEQSIIAFRGEDLGVGISDIYRKVDPEIAIDLLKLASEASEDFSQELPSEGSGLETNLPDAPIEGTSVTYGFMNRLAKRV